jgi:adenylate kinase
MLDIVLLGAPGAGKGTQAELLSKWLGVPRVASGDLFRAAISARTPLGIQAKLYIGRGELVPDDVTIGMVAERVSQPDCAQGVILDGFPRTVAQAESLGAFLSKLERQVGLVAYVRASEEALLQRLAGRWTCKNCGAVYHRTFSPEKNRGVCDVCDGVLYQREDDTPETQLRRIAVYLQQTAPLIAYYQHQGVLVELDGEQSIALVQEALRRAVEAILQRQAR